MTFESDIKPHGLESTIWKIVRGAYLSGLCHASGRAPASLTPEEQNTALDALFGDMEHDVAMLKEVMARAGQEAIERVQHGLHRAEALDHEMVDEAVSYATEEWNT